MLLSSLSGINKVKSKINPVKNSFHECGTRLLHSTYDSSRRRPAALFYRSTSTKYKKCLLRFRNNDFFYNFDFLRCFWNKHLKQVFMQKVPQKVKT